MKYSIIRTTITTEDNEVMDTYGIEGNGVRIEDISVEKVAVENLLERINSYGDVEPNQLMYLAEDLVEELA